MEGCTLQEGNNMYIKRDFDFRDLINNCWECDDVLEAVYDNDKEDALMDLLENECFPYDVPTLTEVNDLLRFEGDWVLETLGINPEEEEDEDDVGEE